MRTVDKEGNVTYDDGCGGAIWKHPATGKIYINYKFVINSGTIEELRELAAAIRLFLKNRKDDPKK